LINSVALAVSALMAPLLGTIADRLGATRRLLLAFTGLGVVATALLAFVGPGDATSGATLFMVGVIGFSSATVFYDALLTSAASVGNEDQLSAAGYALGYLGGGVLLAINVLMIARPAWFGLPPGDPSNAMNAPAVRLSFVTVAVWWALFTVPLWRTVRSTSDDAVHASGAPRPPLGRVIRDSWAQLLATLRHVGRFRDLFVFLIAFWLFSDGIGTFQTEAAAYGNALALPPTALISALLMTQFVGVPFSFAFGALAQRIGARRALFGGLVGFMLISAAAFFLTQTWQFFALAFAVAIVQGGTQAMSRSLFASLVPRGMSSEFFAFFSVSSKFAGILGPLSVFLIIQAGYSARVAILPLVVLFALSIAVLLKVDFDRGQAVAVASAEI
ncbi:MAG: MFS transporter, partial [Ardenticatenales bacterium]